MTEDQSVCSLIVDSDRDKVLSVSRKDDPWDIGLPGGKVEEGESLKEALHRETLEETGLEIVQSEEVFVEDNHRFECHTFRCEVRGTIGSDEPGVIRWVDPEVLQREEMHFSDYNSRLFDHVDVDDL